MNRAVPWAVLMAWGLVAMVASGTLSAAELRVDIAPLFAGRELAFDSLSHETDQGQVVSVTRLDCLLSEIALQRADGTWLGQRDWFAYLSLREGRSGFTLKEVPPERYVAVRFLVGVRPDINRQDAACYPSGHPLNPSVNTLYWGWQGGFVFLALEGGWRRGEGGLGGYSFHLATDRQLMAVELPVALDLATDQAMNLGLDVAQVLQGLRLSDADSSTHSRGEDALADALRRRTERAFTVRRVRPYAPPPVADVRRTTLPVNETPAGFSYPSHFPKPALPVDNPLTLEGIARGRALFHDKRLSLNNGQSCADCHEAAHAFSDARPFSLGVDGKPGTRQAMPLLNLAWKQSFFWDGRAPSLREQVLQPVQNPIEMHETLDHVEAKVGLKADQIARALEQYLLTLVSHDSKLDRAMRGLQPLTAEEKRGFDLFHTEYDPRRGQFGADCFHCHGGALFQNVAFANNGLDREPKDLGRYLVTHQEGDQGKFAVPSLRNVEHSAPYMHDGRFRTLEEVIEHYDHGVQPSATLDPNLAKHPCAGLGLSSADRAALVAFLKTLSEVEPAAP